MQFGHVPSSHSTPRTSVRLRPLARTRRGNSLVLVTAILVLLVIVAVAFISRAQAGRQISAAQQAAGTRDDRVEAIADDLAGMIGDSLFPRPVDPTALNSLGAGYRSGVSIYDPSQNVGTVTSSWPRLQTPPDARIFGIDRDFNFDLQPDFAYNFAPPTNVAWTNWPDFFSASFPAGPGQPDGAVVGAGGGPIGDANPYGNPGYGDTRWLAANEPIRVDTNGDGIPDTFTHWPHLSFIGTAENGYRLVGDISNIVNFTLTNVNESDLTKSFALGMPYEQWLTNYVPNAPANVADFNGRRDAWFSSPNSGASYVTNYASVAALPNLFRLADLAQTTPGVPNPNAAFLNNGNARNAVERTFASVSGTGFTDAFWFLAPQPVDRSIKYLVAARVVDNSALLNVNVATRFNRINTFGAGPSDLALVGDPDTPGRQVGFFDNPAHSFPNGSTDPSLWFDPGDGNLFQPVNVGWTRDRFGDALQDSLTFLQQVGMKFGNGNINPLMADPLYVPPTYPANQQAEWYSPRERLLYFRNGVMRGDDPRFGLTPFTIGDEIELRAFEASNNPFLLSRLERSINREGDKFTQFLRSSPEREETTEYLDQLTNRQWLLDNRRKLTTVSGARNDLRPAWLWPSPYPDPSIDYDGDGQVSSTDGNPATIENPAAVAGDFAAYVRQTKKLDLRRAMDDPAPPANVGNPIVAVAPATYELRRYEWRVEMQRLLERTLLRSWPVSTGGNLQYQSYLGSPTNTNPQYQRQQHDKTRQMAASLTANIDQYRDGPTIFGAAPNLIASDPPLHPALGVQDPIKANLRYIGQEKQPYIMEVFFALVYPKSQTNLPPAVPGQGADPYKIPLIFPGGGEHFVDSSSRPAVVIAVQIANPYSTPINLFDFRLRVFGKSYSFATGSLGAGVTLGPATDAGPTTAIVYAIKDSPTAQAPPATFPFVGTWLDFLDIEATELFTPSLANPGLGTGSDTRIFDATSSWLGSVTVDPPAINPTNVFNNADAESVELVRVIGPQAGPGAGANATVVVDRFDNRVSGPNLLFADTMTRLFVDDKYFPPVQGYEYDPTNPPDRNWMNGIRLGTSDYFVAWVHASRAWRWDVWMQNQQVGDGVITPAEINPRYVFSMGSKPNLPVQTQTGSVSGNDKQFLGDVYGFNQDPDGSDLWIDQSYLNIFGQLRRGKPTFFPCVQREQASSGDNIYGQGFPYPDVNGIYPQGVVVGDKGLQQADWAQLANYKSMSAPLQLTQKDDDFDQLGELLDVFCWGPVIDIGPGVNSPKTEKTFSEIMLQESDSTDQPAGRGLFVNRLRITPFRDPTTDGSSPTDGPTTVLASPPTAPYVPSLPAGVGLFDGVVCDDRGARRLDGIDGSAPDGFISQSELDAAELRRFTNAARFREEMTPGLVNINNVLPEVMRSAPMMARLCNNDFAFTTSDQLIINPLLNPFTRVVDSLLRYRDRTILQTSGTIAPAVPNPNFLPGYVERGLPPGNAAAPLPPGIPGTNGFMGPTLNGQIANGVLPGLRGERGFASIGELLLLQRYLDDPAVDAWNLERSYSIEFAGLDPYRVSESSPGNGAPDYYGGIAPRFSTDQTQGRTTPDTFAAAPPAVIVPDRVGGDAEKRSLLFKGVSNMITTRSDVFTVWFRVRAVKQDPTTGIWDGTRKDLIADDSRYVMIVDRSNVKKPGDKPRILALRKVDG
ncbi:MAG: hypothetical protein U0572_16355 [Phycisphaerales bacterium]